MEYYEIPLFPESAFGTLLKGDTLFGHFCWQVAHDPLLVEKGLEAQLARYAESPFVVLSSAFPRIRDEKGTGWALKRPDVPLHRLTLSKGTRLERMQTGKELKKRRWMFVREWKRISLSEVSFCTAGEVFKQKDQEGAGPESALKRSEGTKPATLRTHNAINRLSGTTGPPPFAPFTSEETVYPPGTEMVVFVYLDPGTTDIVRVKQGLERIGRFGYGKDASTGLGRFSVGEPRALPDPGIEEAEALYTLAPSVPNPEYYESLWFTPFVRFGKHGDHLALSRNPFKNPVVMADEGAVLVLPRSDKRPSKPYVGRAVTDVSRVLPETVVQGYSPVLPLAMES